MADLDDELDPFAGVRTSGKQVGVEGKIAPIGKPRYRSHTRTRPWEEAEYMFVGGQKVCYSVERDIGTVVHFPGGRSMLLRDAWLRHNRDVRPPFTQRLDDVYARYHQLIREPEEE